MGDGATQRIRALRALRILDSAAEPHLEAVCRLAADLFGVPITAVQLVDGNRIWSKVRVGIEAECVSREGAFRDLAIAADDRTPLVIPDLRRDRRSADSPPARAGPASASMREVPRLTCLLYTSDAADE